MNASESSLNVPDQLHFSRQLHRTIIPCLFALWLFGAFAYSIPNGIWYAIPFFCLAVLFCLSLHRGLIISQDEIVWYILRPKWRYRVIPWHAVTDVRVGRFFGPGVRLTVKSGQYEPWVWGSPRPTREMEIDIWTQEFAKRRSLQEAIQHIWLSRNPAIPGASHD